MPNNKNTTDEQRAARSCANRARNTDSRARNENKNENKNQNKNDSRAKK